MPRSSRFIRPEQPRSGLFIQPRDRAILATVFKHRFVRSEHIHQLVFPGTSLRVVQVRLRKLWEFHFLDRYYIPFVLGGTASPPSKCAQPIYGLGQRAAEILDAEPDLQGQLPTTSSRAPSLGLPIFEHHLTATDMLVALQVACRARSDVKVDEVLGEPSLRRMVYRWQEKTGQTCGYVVPDGAVTLSYPPASDRSTFYLEVVRSDVKAGNRSLTAKLRRYALLHRQGYFQRAFGHERVRAVLIATSSGVRAQNLRALAQELVHGRRLFWFGCYERLGKDSRPTTAFTPEAILSPTWITIDNETMSLAAPAGAFTPNPLAHARLIHASSPSSGTPARSGRDDVEEPAPPVRSAA